MPKLSVILRRQEWKRKEVSRSEMTDKIVKRCCKITLNGIENSPKTRTTLRLKIILSIFPYRKLPKSADTIFHAARDLAS